MYISIYTYFGGVFLSSADGTRYGGSGVRKQRRGINKAPRVTMNTRSEN
jgi:hypothetical protein